MSTQPCPDKGTEAELLPCPFCGGDSVSVHDSYVDNQGFMVLCASCTAEGPLCTSVKDAAAEWNRRSMPAAVAEELPTLPEPDVIYEDGKNEWGYADHSRAYSAEMVDKIRRDAIAADRQARASAPAAGAVQQPVAVVEVVDLLKAIRPKYGAVGSRDVEVAAQQRRIDRAIELLLAGAAPAPGNTAQPAPHALDDDKKGGADAN